NVAVDCGWGRLLFGQTFASARDLVERLRAEEPGKRDIALYLNDPHVVLALAPQELFLDPSHTYRLWLSTYLPGRVVPRGFTVRKLQRRSDADAMNAILKRCRMLGADPEFIWSRRDSPVLTYVVVEDLALGDVAGAVVGVEVRK